MYPSAMAGRGESAAHAAASLIRDKVNATLNRRGRIKNCKDENVLLRA